MKQIFKYIGIAAITCSLFTSCNEDDSTGLSTIDYSPATVTLTSSENNVTLDETLIDSELGYAITVTATIDNPLPIDIVVPLTQIGGTGDANDFTAGSITIKSSLTTGSASVIINRTGNTEGNETLSIGAVADEMINNANVIPFSLDVNIENDYVDNNATITFDWSGAAFTSADGSEEFLEFCDMDVDFYLLDPSFSIINDSAATGACPEAITFDPSTLPDGTYSVYADLFCNPYFGASALDFAVPIRGSYTHGYESEFGSGNFDPSFEFNNNSASGPCNTAPDFSGAGAMVATIDVIGGAITVSGL